MDGDEKWITYDNPIRKRSWIKKGKKTQAIGKFGLTRKKVMLYVWWDWKGIIQLWVVIVNQTINSELYCEQLQRLQQAIERKRPELINRRGVVFHHDNARSHTFLTTRQKLRELSWEWNWPISEENDNWWKMITYDNPTRKRSWIKKGEKAQARPGLTRKKVMLCVWWDWKGIVH